MPTVGYACQGTAAMRALPPDSWERVQRCAVLHCTGKIGIAESRPERAFDPFHKLHVERALRGTAGGVIARSWQDER